MAQSEFVAGTLAPSRQAEQPVQSLAIAYTNWKCKTITLSSGDGEQMYTVETRHRKPHMIFKHGTKGPQFGTSALHSWRKKFDFESNGDSFTAELKKKLSANYIYNSPALKQPVTWVLKNGWTTFEYYLEDQHGNVLSRYTTRGMKLMSWKQLGTFEFADSGSLSSTARDEIVVVGLSVAYKLLKQLLNSGAGNASAASAAVA